MEQQKPRDLVLHGVSRASGGDYRNLNIDGVATVNGDIRAEEIRINGMTTLRGNVSAAKLDMDGKLKIDGHLKSGVSEIDGHAGVLGSVTGEQVKLKGVMNVQGDCELERFDVEGCFEISGMLNAGFVNLTLYGLASAKEIGCEGIRVRQSVKSQWKRAVQRTFAKLTPELHAGVIEGDDIDLEHTVASVVRGNRVTLGPGCRIGRVEYRSELRKHPDAKVGEERMTGE